MGSQPEQYRDLAEIDVIFLGAGFSRSATNGQSPLMSDFFVDLDQRQYWTLWSFLELLCNDPRTANVEEALLGLDQLSASPLEGVEPFFDQCRERHSAIREELDSYIIKRLGGLRIPVDNWAASVFSRASHNTTVITTNYDTIADRILANRTGLRHNVTNTNCHHCKLCRILSEECDCNGEMPVDSNWRGSLIKLHGSVSWSRCTNSNCTYKECLLPDRHCRPFADGVCTSCKSRRSPVLVPPSMVKTFNEHRGLKQMWNAAFRALSEAKSVMFWGFSFPKSDVLINQMLRSALAGTERTVDISIVDIEPERPASILEELLDSRCELSGSLFKVPDDNSKPEWIGNPDEIGMSCPTA